MISGVTQPPEGMRPSERRKYLQNKVEDIFDALDVDCTPSEVFWIGRASSNSCLIKVVMPSSFYWRRALANAHLLRHAGYSSVFIRRSMTEEERRREFELRQIARERNKGKASKEWVIYKRELVRVSELPKKRSENA